MTARSAIVSVGDELLAGRVVDTNAAWLGAVLRRAGFPVGLRLTVPDEPGAIADAVSRAAAEAAVVVVGGGIGPTKDDVTREGVALALGVPLAEHPEALELVHANYRKRGQRVPEGSDVQALLPAGATPIRNPVGTAPGMLCRARNDVLIAVVPGVPRELEAMVEESLVPLLLAHPGRGIAPAVESVTIAGLREVDIGRTIADLMERGRDPVVGSYPKLGRVVLTVESRASSPAEAAQRVESTLEEIVRRLGNAVVGRGDLLLNEVVAKLLLERGTTVAIAESVTGGLISDGLVAVAGISRCFLAGYVTYSDRAKTEVLGVPEALIASHGAVSEECVRAMAEGARKNSGAGLGFAVSGVAGPSGGSPGKPVGTVWFALSDADGTEALRVVFPGDRASVRAFTRERAYELMRRRLLRLPW